MTAKVRPILKACRRPCRPGIGRVSAASDERSSSWVRLLLRRREWRRLRSTLRRHSGVSSRSCRPAPILYGSRLALNLGARLGPYEILSSLGAGGMGEVYRARDTKLNRDVALKILPDAFATDPERVARFQAGSDDARLTESSQHRADPRSVISAAAVHASTAVFTHVGIGTVRMCPPLPTRSAITQWSSRCWIESRRKANSSARRSPQPTNIATIARSRNARVSRAAHDRGAAGPVRASTNSPAARRCAALP